mmetsp:Transcript_119620/g.335008  ORF Transcript_119620/g.335008 Transcript_119620/m.335008 type:complete len:228 (+) Transcript_119620:182-865(+)
MLSMLRSKTVFCSSKPWHCWERRSRSAALRCKSASAALNSSAPMHSRLSKRSSKPVFSRSPASSSSSFSICRIVGKMCLFHAGTTIPARPMANNILIHGGEMNDKKFAVSATSATATSNAFSHAKPIKIPMLLTKARTTLCMELDIPATRSKTKIIAIATMVTTIAMLTTLIMPPLLWKKFATMPQSMPKKIHQENVMPAMLENCAVIRGMANLVYKIRNTSAATRA